jgi:hypothetical protein
MGIRARFSRILDTCEPYLVASPLGAAAEPGPMPLGLAVRPDHHFDPHLVASGPFLSALQRLDELTFGPVGMTMPRWVFYDCAEVPGGIFGFARPAEQLPEWVLRALKVDADYDGPVPLSMFVAIPMMEPGNWHIYTLCSVNEVAPGSAPVGLRQLTQAAALATFGVETAYGATQWRSHKLSVHAHFGPLELLTAWTPAHSDPATLTFRFPVSKARLEHALASGPTAARGPLPDRSRLVDCDDEDELRALQAALEAGDRLEVVGGRILEGSFARVPVREIEAP